VTRPGGAVLGREVDKDLDDRAHLARLRSSAGVGALSMMALSYGSDMKLHQCHASRAWTAPASHLGADKRSSG